MLAGVDAGAASGGLQQRPRGGDASGALGSAGARAEPSEQASSRAHGVGPASLSQLRALSHRRARYPAGGGGARLSRAQTAAGERDAAVAARMAQLWGADFAHSRLRAGGSAPSAPFGSSDDDAAERAASAVALDRLLPCVDAAAVLCAAPHLMAEGPREWALGLVRLASQGEDAAAAVARDPALLHAPSVRWRWTPASRREPRGRWARRAEGARAMRHRARPRFVMGDASNVRDTPDGIVLAEED